MRFKPLILLLALAITACGDAPQVTQQALPKVSIIQVMAQDTPISIEFVGKTVSSRKVEIRSRVEGFLEEIAYREGSMVQEGQILFQMDRKPFQAKLDATKAELSQQMARLDNAKANLDRIKPLAAKKAVSQKDLDDALGTYYASAAAVEGARADIVQAELNLGYTTLYSPVTGLSSYAERREGSYLGYGSESLLTYVAQLDPMWVEFSISENQLLKNREQIKQGLIREPNENELGVQVILADGSTYPETGKLTFADASLSEETGTFLVRAEVANPKHVLRPGQFVRALITGMVRPNAIQVPQIAVQQGARGSFVWVIDSEGKAEFRPVETGPWHGDQWFINSGLKDGETVVVDGALKLQAGTAVSATPFGESSKEEKPAQEEQAPQS